MLTEGTRSRGPCVEDQACSRQSSVLLSGPTQAIIPPPLLTPLASSPQPAEVTRAEGNPATSLGMGNCDRKVLWALGFLLLLGSSSAQDTWEAMLPARLAEKSRVSARRGGGASVVGGGPGDIVPRCCGFLSWWGPPVLEL